MKDEDLESMPDERRSDADTGFTPVTSLGVVARSYPPTPLVAAVFCEMRESHERM